MVHLAALPPKLNSIIQPLVAAIRREPQAALQDAAAAAMARLTLLCAGRTPSPNDKCDLGAWQAGSSSGAGVVRASPRCASPSLLHPLPSPCPPSGPCLVPAGS